MAPRWGSGYLCLVPEVPYALIEDQTPIRETLHEYLCAQPEFACQVVAGSIEEFLALLPGAAQPPQLILSDIGLPGSLGIEGLPLIQAALPEAQVLMLSVYADAERVYQALCAGAVASPARTAQRCLGYWLATKRRVRGPRRYIKRFPS